MPSQPKRPHPGYFYKSGVVCHLCGYPIPDWIVSPTHPLFGTIDHVIPRSLGGKNYAANRAPAHRFCNSRRGVLDITATLKAVLTSEVELHFVGQPIPPKNQRWKRLRQAVRKYSRG